MEICTHERLAEILASASNPDNVAEREFLARELPKSLVSFEYWSARNELSFPRYKPQLVRVTRVRDPFIEPLADETLRQDPHLFRCGLLIYGDDMEGRPKKFWTASIRSFRICRESDDYSVAWITVPPEFEWQPGDELPDEYSVESALIEEVSSAIANDLAAAGNAFLKRCQNEGSWLAPVRSLKLPRPA